MPDRSRDDDRRRSGRRPLVTAAPLALLAALALSPGSVRSGPVSVGLPAPGEQRFRVYYGDLGKDLVVAEIVYRLEHGGDAYGISAQGKAVGMVAIFYSGVLSQNSVGRIGGTGLLPEQYTERRGRRPERVLRFDHASRVMIGNGDPAQVALLPGTQDRLSVFYQLGLMARSTPSLMQSGNRFSMPLAAMKRIDEATFVVAGAETVKTARGNLPAVRLTVRNEADPDSLVFDIWLAARLAMLPARIRMRESDGKVIDQVVVPPD